MTPTLGRHHPTVRRLRALRRDPALRREQNVFLAEGVHLAQEALRCGADVELVVASAALEARPEGPELLRAIERRGLARVLVDDGLMGALQDARSPQPIVTVVRRRASVVEAAWSGGESTPLVLAAVGVQDPGNLGGLVRTADAAGATGCLVTEGSVDPFHPRAVRATMGSIFRIPVVLVSEGDLADRAREGGLRLLGTDPSRGTDYARCDLTRAAALCFGSEGRGLPTPLRASIEEWVRVPMRPGVDSLSVGAAAAVVLFEAARQRGAVSSQPSDL